jgi:hypothetical protein
MLDFGMNELYIYPRRHQSGTRVRTASLRCSR